MDYDDVIVEVPTANEEDIVNNDDIPSQTQNRNPRKTSEKKHPRLRINKDKDAIRHFNEHSKYSAYFYTGLTAEQRRVLWNFLGEAKDFLTIFKTKRVSGKLRTMTVKSQFLLTLFILRRGRKYADISYHFHIGAQLVSRIFKTWIQFIYQNFYDIRDTMFVRKCDVKKPLPRHFRNNLCRDTRVVIDCTEIQVENASNFRQQGAMYSHYKTNATVKILIGVAPSGGASYISDAFEGSISDREIVIQTDFLDYIEKIDLVLADRGFTITDLLAEKGARLNMPPFLRGRKCFTLNENQSTKIIAKARIHVERFNRRFKKFDFFTGRVSQKNLPIISQAAIF
jgi:hypothetical protein